MRYQQRKLNQTGFTIVELMIATTILSVILLLVTIVMISIGNLYYKGINQARVQDTVHNITDEVSQHLQLSGTSTPVRVTSPDGKTVAYCIGATRYTFILGQQIGTGTDTDHTTPQSPHVIWRDTAPVGCPAPNNTFLDTATPSPSGTELIAPNSRLTNFCISGSAPGSCIPDTSPYTVSVGIAYGAIDLLSNPTSLNPTCKGSNGDQFCATANLTTVVAQRLTAE